MTQRDSLAMRGARLLSLMGDGREWPLHEGRDSVVGRGTRRGAQPEIDLPLDQTVSRQHARLLCDNDAWWIEDLRSKHGTYVDGKRLEPGRPERCKPAMEIGIAGTRLVFLPSDWHVLHSDGLTIEIGVSPVVNQALWYSGVPIVSAMVARNVSPGRSKACQLALSIAGRAWATVALPALAPGESKWLAAPSFHLDEQALEIQAERVRETLAAEIDGQRPADDRIELWLLAHNEWSRAQRHRLSLAAFIIPNHPLVSSLAARGQAIEPAAVLEEVFGHLRSTWQIHYRLEPPHFDSDSQKVRLPHQVLTDPIARTGAGTCLDLALLIAGILESRGESPLVALVDLGTTWHALVGCWRIRGPRLEPVVVDRERLLADAVWVDPNACTREVARQKHFSAACEDAEAALRRQPLIFALDVSAARLDGINPLPFAGEPQWSKAASDAILYARRVAEGARAQLATVPLLVGLLSLEGGITSETFGACNAEGRAVAARLASALPVADSLGIPSRHYSETLAIARTYAKREGSALVAEGHLLAALFDRHSAALDSALDWVGLKRASLRSALHDLVGEEESDASYFGGPGK